MVRNRAKRRLREAAAKLTPRKLAATPAGSKYPARVLLVGIASPLVPGTRLTVTLRFEKAGEITLDVPVRDARAETEHHHH